VQRLADACAAAVGSGPLGVLDERYGALWQAIVAGSGNIAYRLALNSLMAALAANADIAVALLPGEAEPVRALGAAIAGADEGAAAVAATRLLEPSG
jgi:DNA-binding FadR family transcriptional regulator